MANITVPPVQISNPDYSLITNIQRPPIIDAGAGFNQAWQAGEQRRQQREMQEAQLKASQDQWAAELGMKREQLQMAAGKASQEMDQDELKLTGTIATTILMADPKQQPALYEQAKQLAVQKGVDVTQWPEKYGPQAEQLMKGLSVVSGEALRIGASGRAPAATVTTPEGTQVSVGGQQGAPSGALGIFPAQQGQPLTQPALVDKQKQETATLKQSDADALESGTSRQNIGLAREALNTLDRYGAETGPLAGSLTKAKAAAGEYTGDPESIEINRAIQTLNNVGGSMRGAIRKSAIGPGPVSDYEGSVITSLVPGLGVTKSQNRAIIDLADATASRAVEQNKFIHAYKDKHGTLDGAAGQWVKFTDENPLIRDRNKLTMEPHNIGGWEAYLDKSYGKGNIYVKPNGERGTIQQIEEAAKKQGMSSTEFIKKYDLAPLHPRKAGGDKLSQTEPLKPDNLPLDDPKVKKVAQTEKPIQTAYQLASLYLGKTEQGDKILLATTFNRMLGSPIDPTKVPWCAAFVNAMEKAAGRKGTGSLAARSFLNYGTPTKLPIQGDIVVLKSPSNPSDTVHGHVGFFSKFVDGGRGIEILGGNQGDKVSKKVYPAHLVLGYRTIPNADALRIVFNQSK